MKPDTTRQQPPSTPDSTAPRPRAAYEPPRILARRPVEQVTLSFNEEITPGGGIGEP